MIMKKLLILFAVISAALGANAELKRYTNLHDKIPSEGYVGFAGAEIMSPGFYGDGGFSAGVTTAHGWMLRPTVFLGLGTGYIADFQDSKGVIPIFAEGRIYFPSEYMRRIYPHINLRAGGIVGTEGGGGTYFQAGAGFRVPLSEKLALNVEVGPQYATSYTRERRSDVINHGGPFKSGKMRFAFFGRINFEF